MLAARNKATMLKLLDGKATGEVRSWLESIPVAVHACTDTEDVLVQY